MQTCVFNFYIVSCEPFYEPYLEREFVSPVMGEVLFLNKCNFNFLLSSCCLVLF